MLHAIDSWDAGQRVVDNVIDDRTEEIAEATAIAEAGGTDVIDSIASGPGQVLCPPGTAAWIDHSRTQGRSVVIVTPYGTCLPELLWGSYLDRNGFGTPIDSDVPPVGAEVIEIDRFDDLIGGQGIRPLDAWSPDCPDVVEIARR